jgi:hypothetical protein
MVRSKRKSMRRMSLADMQPPPRAKRPESLTTREQGDRATPEDQREDCRGSPVQYDEKDEGVEHCSTVEDGHRRLDDSHSRRLTVRLKCSQRLLPVSPQLRAANRRQARVAARHHQEFRRESATVICT